LNLQILFKLKQSDIMSLQVFTGITELDESILSYIDDAVVLRNLSLTCNIMRNYMTQPEIVQKLKIMLTDIYMRIIHTKLN
jgi:hypothetical protein